MLNKVQTSVETKQTEELAHFCSEITPGVRDLIGKAADIVYSNLFTGVHGNYLKKSIENAGLDPNNLPESDPSKMNFGSGGNTKAKAWKDIWGCGQGIGNIDEVLSAGELVAKFSGEYNTAVGRVNALTV